MIDVERIYGAIADLASTDYPTNSAAGDGLPRWTSAHRATLIDRGGAPMGSSARTHHAPICRVRWWSPFPPPTKPPPMNRFLARGLLAALTAHRHAGAQGRETDTLSSTSALARVAYLTQLPGTYNYQDTNWHPFYQGSALRTLQSVSKSITSLVYGVAITRGAITTIDQLIARFLPAHANAFRDSVRKQITIRHLLTMTSGIDWPEGGGYGSNDDITQRMETSADWVSMVLEQPMATAPRSTYHYNDGATALLAEVFRGATGMDLQAYANEYLFTPLGITRFHLKRSSGGLTDSEGGVYLEPSDLAKIGQPMLDQGVWNGTRLVSAAWVAESVRGQLPTKPGQPPMRTNYGLMWWTVGPGVLQDAGAFSARGYGGQYPFVFPKTHTVAVLNRWMFKGQEISYLEFARRIEKALATMP